MISPVVADLAAHLGVAGDASRTTAVAVLELDDLGDLAPASARAS
jgi:hypothetical protein